MRFRFGTIVTAIALSAAATAAQGETIVKTFDAGGVTHVIAYPDWREKAAQASEAAIAHAFSVFQPLWTGSNASSEIGFEVFVELSEVKLPQTRASAGLTDDTSILPAGHTATRPKLCHVTVYNYVLDDSTLFVIAHELAHCYQAFFIPNSPNGIVEGTRWWVEGSADWMALLVYPDASWASLWSNEFTTTTHRRYLFALTYDAVFYFEFLASPMALGSPEAVIEFLRGMPATPPSSGVYEDYLTSAVGDAGESFHNFMIAIGRTYLKHAPNLMPVTHNLYDVSPLPYEGEIGTEPFSIDYFKLIGFGLDDFYLEGMNLDAAGIRASVVDAGGSHELKPGTIIPICGPRPNEIYVGVSRAKGNPNAAMEGRIRVAPATKEICAQHQSFLASGMPTIPNCLAGDWKVVHIPPLGGLLTDVPDDVLAETSIDDYGIILTLYGDSVFSVTFEVKATTPDAATVIQAQISGYLGLQPSKVRGNSYDAVSAYAGIVPGTAGGYAAVGGIIVDVSDTLKEVFEFPGNLLPLPTYLTCTGDDTMDYAVFVDGVEQIWKLQRMTPAP
jgi:hypothetical protein